MSSFYKIFFISLVLGLVSHIQAQDDLITSPADTAGMGDMLRVKPEDVKPSPEGEAKASDSLKKAAYLLQRLKDVVNIPLILSTVLHDKNI